MPARNTHQSGWMGAARMPMATSLARISLMRAVASLMFLGPLAPLISFSAPVQNTANERAFQVSANSATSGAVDRDSPSAPAAARGHKRLSRLVSSTCSAQRADSPPMMRDSDPGMPCVPFRGSKEYCFCQSTYAHQLVAAEVTALQAPIPPGE